MLMFHLYYTGCVFVYLMYIYLSSEINIYLSIYLYHLNRLYDLTDTLLDDLLSGYFEIQIGIYTVCHAD